MDVGAGEGRYTNLLLEKAKYTIALEPNPDLRIELQKRYPTLEIWPDMIADTNVAPASANFILCSHVFYFIEPDNWLKTLDTLGSWLAKDGLLVVILARPKGTCMSICEHFYDRCLDLSLLAKDMQQKTNHDFEIILETLPVKITAPDLNTAYKIAEFLLNPPPSEYNLPSHKVIEDYIKKHCMTAQGEYQFSCDQYLLQLRA
jgi:hypothetical protein